MSELTRNVCDTHIDSSNQLLESYSYKNNEVTMNMGATDLQLDHLP